MAYSNGLLHTRIIDPIFHSNDRTEFRLPSDMVFASNMRVSGLGAVRIGNGDKAYNALSGAYSLLRNIWLYDNNQLLCELQNAHLYLGWNGLNQTNGYNGCNNMVVSKNELGFYVNDTDNDKITSLPNIGVGNHGMMTNDANTTAKAWLDLRRVFGFLASNSMVDSSKFKNLRIVIEYRPQADMKLCLEGDANTLTGATIERPVLIVDQIANDKQAQAVMSDKSGNMPYYSVQTERIVIGAAAAGVVVQDKHRSNFLNGKRCDELLMINYDSASSIAQGAGNAHKTEQSRAMLSESVQMVINQETFFDLSGVDSPARKLALLVDTVGNTNQTVGSNQHFVNARNELTTAGTARNLASAVSYGGVDLGGRVINNLQFQYKRTGRVGNYNAFELHLFAKVRKNLQYKDGVYRISY